MSGETGRNLRLLVQADKEIKISTVTVTDVPSLLSSQLVGENYRKGLQFYNNSDSASGELYAGDSDAVNSSNGFPIKKGMYVPLPVATSLPVYLVAASGEIGDLRVIELA